VPATATLVIRNALVATCDRGPSDAGLIRGGAVATANGKVTWVGPDAELESAVEAKDAESIDAMGGLVTPGLVDCHTHLVFAGERADELAMRCAGKSYLEIARAGGGIASTVTATRAAGERELARLALPRALRLLAQGITTAEVKSGYGLSLTGELAMLRAIDDLDQELGGDLELVPTLLAAHAVPAERQSDRAGWVREVCESIIPEVAREKLAVF
jgi:imidazolonepropionase